MHVSLSLSLSPFFTLFPTLPHFSHGISIERCKDLLPRTQILLLVFEAKTSFLFSSPFLTSSLDFLHSCLYLSLTLAFPFGILHFSRESPGEVDPVHSILISCLPSSILLSLSPSSLLVWQENVFLPVPPIIHVTSSLLFQRQGISFSLSHSCCLR